tara:strand:- start:4391 stop:6610 length:2220 start_codon:yes stop_codon:yes gene_type:complete
MDDELYFSQLITKSLEPVDSDQRFFEGYLTVQVKDKQGEVTIVDELIKVLPVWMARGAPISDTHSNRIVGKGINFSKTDYTSPEGDSFPAIKITGMIHKDYELDNEIWSKIKSGEYSGLSFGGATKADREPMRMKDGSIAYALSKLEHYEVAVCKDPAVPLAVITDFNPVAKSLTNSEKRDDGKLVVRCNKVGCYIDKADDVTKPIPDGKGGRGSFEQCVRNNQDKDKPEGWCGAIQQKLEKTDAQKYINTVDMFLSKEEQDMICPTCNRPLSEHGQTNKDGDGGMVTSGDVGVVNPVNAGKPKEKEKGDKEIDDIIREVKNPDQRKDLIDRQTGESVHPVDGKKPRKDQLSRYAAHVNRSSNNFKLSTDATSIRLKNLKKKLVNKDTPYGHDWANQIAHSPESPRKLTDPHWKAEKKDSLTGRGGSKPTTRTIPTPFGVYTTDHEEQDKEGQAETTRRYHGGSEHPQKLGQGLRRPIKTPNEQYGSYSDAELDTAHGTDGALGDARNMKDTPKKEPHGGFVLPKPVKTKQPKTGKSPLRPLKHRTISRSLDATALRLKFMLGVRAPDKKKKPKEDDELVEKYDISLFGVAPFTQVKNKPKKKPKTCKTCGQTIKSCQCGHDHSNAMGQEHSMFNSDIGNQNWQGQGLPQPKKEQCDCDKHGKPTEQGLTPNADARQKGLESGTSFGGAVRNTVGDGFTNAQAPPDNAQNSEVKPKETKENKMMRGNGYMPRSVSRKKP